MQRPGRNQLIIGAIAGLAAIVLCIIFAMLVFLTVTELNLSANVANLSASMAANRPIVPGINATGRGDLRATFDARRATPTP